MGASPGRPGGTQFLVLQSTSGFSVVAPFQEIDAAPLQPDMPAHVTLDALPDVTLDGAVLAVSPASTDIANVVNHDVTIAVARPDPARGRADGADVGDHRSGHRRRQRPELGRRPAG